jgi:hypothetical protein
MKKKSIKMSFFQKRFLEHFQEIEDEAVKELLADIIDIESKNRSLINFPIRKIRDAVDAYAVGLEESRPNGRR